MTNYKNILEELNYEYIDIEKSIKREIDYMHEQEKREKWSYYIKSINNIYEYWKNGINFTYYTHLLEFEEHKELEKINFSHYEKMYDNLKDYYNKTYKLREYKEN